MRAVIQRAYGEPGEVLAVGELPVPEPGEGEVLVRVKYASVHADVWHLVTGRPFLVKLFAGLKQPNRPVPGTDLSGIVTAVGSGVTRFKSGDEVFGESHMALQWRNGGAFAEYAAVPEKRLVSKPSNITFEQAASVPTSGIIAYLNLLAGGEIWPGKQILINGAGGGVGTLALQIAKAGGAEVTVVDTAAKLEYLLGLGANRFIDFTRVDILASGLRFDAILDVASTLPFPACKSLLTSEGIYVRVGHEHYGRPEGQGMRRFFGLVFRSLFDRNLPKMQFAFPDMQDVLETLRQMLEEGHITPVIDRVYSLEQLPEAIDRLANESPIGKILLSPEL